MQDTSSSRSVLAILRSLGWPLVYGLTAYGILFVLLQKQVITQPLLVRYLSAHPVSYIVTAMFLVGLAALIIKAIEVAVQFGSQRRVQLIDIPEDHAAPSQAAELLKGLKDLPANAQSTYLWRRLHDALRFVDRKGSADGLDDELKYLADQDMDRQHESYSLVRIVIWATPMLGFLGTVIGISEALGGINIVAGNFETMMQGLRDSLYIAFDTTALALTLSIVLMFVQFLVDRFESQLLDQASMRTNEALIGRFAELGGGHDPVTRSLDRLAKAMISVTGQLVEKQAELWQHSLEQSQQQWQETTDATSRQVEDSLTRALDRSLVEFSSRISETTQSADLAASRRWEQLQVALSENARRMSDHQTELLRQSEVLERAVAATGEVTKLEKALNDNLNALSETGRFEETVSTLAAAIALLNSRLSGKAASPSVDLSSSDSADKAA